jgi:hypothetical protein
MEGMGLCRTAWGYVGKHGVAGGENGAGDDLRPLTLITFRGHSEDAPGLSAPMLRPSSTVARTLITMPA